MDDLDLIPELSDSLNDSEIEILRKLYTSKESTSELLTPFDLFRLSDPNLLHRIHPQPVEMQFEYPKSHYWSKELLISFTMPSYNIYYDVSKARKREMALKGVPVDTWIDKTDTRFRWVVNGCKVKMYRCTIVMEPDGSYKVHNYNYRRDGRANVSPIQIEKIGNLFISIAKNVLSSNKKKYKEVLLRYHCVKTGLISKDLEAARKSFRGHTSSLYDFVGRMKKSLIDLEN